MAAALIKIYPDATRVDGKLPSALAGNGIEILYHNGNQWMMSGDPQPRVSNGFNLRDYTGWDPTLITNAMDITRAEIALCCR